MKIQIITGSFPPDINPRAFRTIELATRLAKIGHEVTVTTLSSTSGFNYKKYAQELGITVESIPIYNHNNLHHDNSKKGTRISKYVKQFIKYYFGGLLFIYAHRVKANLKIGADTDLVISISVPFVTHLAVSRYRRKHSSLLCNTVFVADSGDPFSTCQQFKVAPYFKWLERDVYKQFDYLTIPTIVALPAYTDLIPSKKIKIVPQGFNFDVIRSLPQYKKNLVPHFAYAGVFYQGIRNPEFLFDYLERLEIPFVFFLYLREKDSYVEYLIKKYSVLIERGAIKIQYGKNRDDLLIELATMDFLINIGNTTSVQVPSKLIDYAIVNRPFISFTQETFRSDFFNEFLAGNYDHSERIENIDQYRIENVANDFLNLKNLKY